jgi:hypothetical protein
MDVAAVVSRFHRILLSWDYFALCGRAEEGKGVYDSLRRVPNTFASIQVRARFRQRWAVRVCCGRLDLPPPPPHA